MVQYVRQVRFEGRTGDSEFLVKSSLGQSQLGSTSGLQESLSSRLQEHPESLSIFFEYKPSQQIGLNDAIFQAVAPRSKHSGMCCRRSGVTGPFLCSSRPQTANCETLSAPLENTKTSAKGLRHVHVPPSKDAGTRPQPMLIPHWHMDPMS